MATLTSLPPEVLIKIFVELSASDIGRLAQVCNVLNQVSNVDLIWEQKIHDDFGIKLKATSDNDPKTFYKCILHRYGQFLGCWQLCTFGLYGGLFQFAYDDWSLKLIEWSPPTKDEVKDPMRPKEFLNLSLDEDDKTKITLVNKSMYLDQSEEALKDIIISRSITNGISVFLPKVNNSEADSSKYDQMLKDFILYEYERELSEDFIHEIHLSLPKFNTKLNCRKVLGFNRLENEKLAFKPDVKQRPIPRGTFKGTYGGHGIEIINIDYPSKELLEATKISGDPNVPFNKVTFKADLNKAMRFTKEEQTDASCASLLASLESDLLTFQVIDFEDENQPPAQPFIIPEDALDRGEAFHYKECLYRFVGEAQIAYENYENPTMIPAHVVVFDCDTFGVLFLGINSFSLYSRIKENISAINYKDVK